ncbi:MAG TPA: glutathione S-transferase family protein [Polyangia bacterium]|nr:glutathione S-transferase family protein [Polyangia bacterium]
MSELVLYSYNISPYAAKVRAVLRWKGLSFREQIIHPARRRILRAKSGQVLVPVLEDAGRVIADSTRILAYLDEKYPERPILPADPIERARAKLLEEWADEGLPHVVQPVRWLMKNNFQRVAAQMRAAYPRDDAGEDLFFAVLSRTLRLDMARKYGPRLSFGHPGRHLTRLAEVLDYVEGALLPSGWLVGLEPTVADFAVAAWISLLRGLDGWETVRMRRKLVKLAKALIPEEDSEDPETGKESPPPAQYKEAYDPEDQALIEASRLRRASKGT